MVSIAKEKRDNDYKPAFRMSESHRSSSSTAHSLQWSGSGKIRSSVFSHRELCQCAMAHNITHRPVKNQHKNLDSHLRGTSVFIESIPDPVNNIL
jgi:hypothetical protein